MDQSTIDESIMKRWIFYFVFFPLGLTAMVYGMIYFSFFLSLMPLNEVLVKDYNTCLLIENAQQLQQDVQIKPVSEALDNYALTSFAKETYNRYRQFLSLEMPFFKNDEMERFFIVDYPRSGKVLIYDLGMDNLDFHIWFPIYESIILPVREMLNKNHPYSMHSFDYEGQEVKRLFIKEAQGNTILYLVLMNNLLIISGEIQAIQWTLQNYGRESETIPYPLFEQTDRFSGNLHFITNNTHELANHFPILNLFNPLKQSFENDESLFGNVIISGFPLVKTEYYTNKYPFGEIFAPGRKSMLLPISVSDWSIETHIPTSALGYFTINIPIPVSTDTPLMNVNNRMENDFFDNQYIPLELTLLYLYEDKSPVLILHQMEAYQLQQRGLLIKTDDGYLFDEKLNKLLDQWFNIEIPPSNPILFSQPYQEYLYLSNQQLLLTEIIDNIQAGEVLANNTEFLTFKELFMGEFHMLGYFSIPKLTFNHSQSSFILSNMISKYDKMIISVKEFQDVFLTSNYLYGEYNPQLINMPNFPQHLTSQVLFPPQLINYQRSREDSQKKIMIVTADNRFYCLTPQGDTLYPYPVELPTHLAFPPVFAENQNTESFYTVLISDNYELFVLDENGQMLDNYPIWLEKIVYYTPIELEEGIISILLMTAPGSMEVRSLQGGLLDDYPKRFNHPVDYAKLVDLEYDGNKEIVVINDNSLHIYNLSLQLIAYWKLPFSIESTTYLIKYIDVTGDYQQDILLFETSGTLIIADTQNHQLYISFDLFRNNHIIDYNLIDQDNDGRKDMVVLLENGDVYTIAIVKAITEQSIPAQEQTIIPQRRVEVQYINFEPEIFLHDNPPPARNSSMIIRDINNDRHWDIIYITKDNRLFSINQEGESYDLLNLPCSYPPIIRDIDYDNTMEILYAYKHIITLAKFPSFY